MIDRYYLKSEVSETQLREALATIGSTPWMLEEQPDKWHLVLDGRDDIFDKALADIQSYPDPRVAYEVAYTTAPVPDVVGKQAGMINVTDGKTVRAVKVSSGVDLTKLKDGDLLTMLFEKGDRRRPVVIG
jgi:hypothetical protein